MIADFAGGREGDFVEAFTKPFPAGVFLDMMGLPEEHSARFVEWAGTMIASSDQQALVSTLKKIIAYLREVIAARIAQPRDDLVSLAVSAEVDGEKLNDEEVLGLCVLLFNAGLDTIGSALSFQIRHLAEHPEHQRALRDDPSLIPRAVDELARAYSVVNVIRVVREDTEYGGVTMRKGDRVICSTLLAGRDPDEFADPDRIDFTRKGAGHHLGFGTGIHLCIGATLAKREIGIAIAELLARLPEFRVRPGEELTAHGGGTVGLKRLPLVW
jgi:cytochrome P450